MDSDSTRLLLRPTVDDLDREIKGAKILFGPYSPLPGYRVAMIEEQGVPIELVETNLTDEELSLLEPPHG